MFFLLFVSFDGPFALIGPWPITHVSLSSWQLSALVGVGEAVRVTAFFCMRVCPAPGSERRSGRRSAQAAGGR
jgi:hypothetical protein